MTRTFLLDGTALAYRSHFAFSVRSGGLTTADGQPTGAIFGFTLTLRALLEHEKPDRIAVAFDGPIEKLERTAIYPAYKATREKAPEELVLQFEPCREIVKAYGIPILEVEGQEADDVIGTMAMLAKAAGDEVFIVTSDKDFMQLVDDTQVKLYDLRSSAKDPKILGPAEVIEKFSVPPELIIDLLALMGDSSDNVPGVKGVGPKTAALLLNEHGSLEAVLDNANEIKQPKLRENLLAGRESAMLSRRLVTIRTDLDLGISLDDMVAGSVDTQMLAELFQRFEFRSFLDELKKHEQADGKAASFEQDYRIVESLGECKALAKRLEAKGTFAFDTETTGLDMGSLELVGLSFSNKTGKAFYVPIRGPDLPDGHDAAAWLAVFKPVLEDEAIDKIGQNMKYDIEVLHTSGIDVKGLQFDTMLASYCCAPGVRRHSLDALSLTYFDYRKIPTSEIIGTGKKAVTMAEVAVETVGHYACEDADFTFRLAEVLRQELEEQKVSELFFELEMPLIPVLISMEERGIKLDIPYMLELGQEMGVRILSLQEQIFEISGESFNLNSPQQLGEMLFDKMAVHKEIGARAPKKTKTGQYKTDAGVLEGLAAHPIAERILEYRKLSKLKGTYLDTLPELVRPATGRLHTSFNQVVAATGRLSSDNPNLQNIPIRTQDGRRIRKAFIPGEEGWVLLSADYSQVELRILAHLSGDEKLCKGFEAGQDVHAQTAAFIHAVAPGLVTPEMRSHAKAINYGLVYGMGPTRLASETGLSIKDAKRFIEAYFAAMPKVKAWLDATIADAREALEVRTLFGRVRPLPDLNAKAQLLRVQAENKALNSPIQGTAADIIKRAMLKLHNGLIERKLESRMLLQVHDELVLECPQGEVDEVRELVRTCMEGAAELRVPLVVDIGVGANWLEAH